MGAWKRIKEALFMGDGETPSQKLQCYLVDLYTAHVHVFVNKFIILKVASGRITLEI